MVNGIFEQKMNQRKALICLFLYNIQINQLFFTLHIPPPRQFVQTTFPTIANKPGTAQVGAISKAQK